MENSYDESSYFRMSDNNYTRPAQIPITFRRFDYLVNGYSPDHNKDWIMFHHPGHFVIYNKASRHCLFDASYIMFGSLNDKRCDNDGAFAVIPQMVISTDHELFPVPIENDFGLLCDLLSKDL